MINITENKLLNGIEVTFDKKPSSDVLTTLKDNGFRWHRQKKLWYAKDTEERRTVLLNLKGGNIAPKMEEQKVKDVENIHGVKVGDIYILSFGYSMILYDFFQVVSVSEKSCRIVEIAIPCTSNDYMSPRFKGELGVTYPRKENSQWIKDQDKGDVKRTFSDGHLMMRDYWMRPYDGREVEEDHWD